MTGLASSISSHCSVTCSLKSSFGQRCIQGSSINVEGFRHLGSSVHVEGQGLVVYRRDGCSKRGSQIAKCDNFHYEKCGWEGGVSERRNEHPLRGRFVLAGPGNQQSRARRSVWGSDFLRAGLSEARLSRTSHSRLSRLTEGRYLRVSRSRVHFKPGLPRAQSSSSSDQSAAPSSSSFSSGPVDSQTGTETPGRKNIPGDGAAASNGSLVKGSGAEEGGGGKGNEKQTNQSAPRGKKAAGWLGGRPAKKEGMADRIMGLVVNATSAPIGSYVAEPVTFLHRMDPRVKQLWLLTLVFLPARAALQFKFAVALGLGALTMVALPRRIAKDQLSRLLLICALIFVSVAFGADGVPPIVQPRTLPPHLSQMPPLSPPSAAFFPLSLAGPYKYVLLKLGPFQLTSKGASLAAVASTLAFIIFQSASLGLTTTTPEATAGALGWLLRPLTAVGVSSNGVVMRLLLSLRFMGLVFEEVRSLALGVVARGVDWGRLQYVGSVDILLNLVGRLFNNLFAHADQISQAMVARGFGGEPSSHTFYFVDDFQMKARDWIALVAYCLFIFLWIVVGGSSTPA